MGEAVYYVRGNQISVTCPSCRFSREVSVAEFLNHPKNVILRLSCKCGHAHRAMLERRAHQRKFTRLDGRYIYLTDKFIHTEGEILVSDLSSHGIGFILLKTPSVVPLPGDPLSVQFKINKLPGALFKKEVVVKNFRGGRVGARFSKKITYATDKTLKIFMSS